MANTPDIAAKAETLIESLPWLKQYRGQTIVVKYGGNAMVDLALQRAFAADMVYLHQVGVQPVVVHGGGPQISARLAERGIPSEFRGGLRVTTPEVMEVVREVLAGDVNAQIAALIDEHAASPGDRLAARLSGETEDLLVARRRMGTVDGKAIDIGWVGDVVKVNPSAVLAELDAGLIPVVSSIAVDADATPGPGDTAGLNVNADWAAAALAVGLGAAKLIVLTDVAGLYRSWPDESSLVSSIRADELEQLIPSLQSGMIPKMEACLSAVQQGVPKAAIIDGRQPHSILLEIFTQTGVGTLVTA